MTIEMTQQILIEETSNTKVSACEQNEYMFCFGF